MKAKKPNNNINENNHLKDVELHANVVEDKNRIIKLFRKPLILLKESGKFGTRGAKRFFGIIFHFGLTNTALFAYIINRLFQSNFCFTHLLIRWLGISTWFRDYYLCSLYNVSTCNN